MGPSQDFMQSGEPLNHVAVIINKVQYNVPITFSEVTLNDYLRTHLHLTGTKFVCGEGECGACIVHASFPDPAGSGYLQCLIPILSCDGYEITTVEGIGDQNNPHPVQKVLTEHYGTQCGYCTPGMVMRMYSLLETQSGQPISKELIESAIDGNTCRCTGYRPILEAFKTFGAELGDLEDCEQRICPTSGSICLGKCVKKGVAYAITATMSGPPWLKPTTLDQLYDMVKTFSGKNTYFVVGHTANRALNELPYDIYVDLKGVPDLFKIASHADKLVVGAAVSITDLITTLNTTAGKPGFGYLSKVADLIFKTANWSIRNAGSWGGNFMMKNHDNASSSDSFTAMAAADAKLVVGPGEQVFSMADFLKVNMTGKILLRMEIPTRTADYIFRGYKVMPRSGNAYAYINAAFLAKIDRSSDGKCIFAEKPRLIFGNMSASFFNAANSETFLNGKDIADVNILRQALTTLNAELNPKFKPAEVSPEYKKSLGFSLFYKFALEVVGALAEGRYQSAVGDLYRPLSSGIQSYETNQANWPLSQPMPKLESMVQCTGEANYVSDIEDDRLLHAALVLTKMGNAAIYSINSVAAQGLPGVVRVITAGDVPGKNIIALPGYPSEQFLATKESLYAGQAIAIVVADTKTTAENAAKLVDVKYTNVHPAVVTCQDAIREKTYHIDPQVWTMGNADQVLQKAKNKISGEFELGTQHHFHMETMAAVSYPHEDGLNVESSTQFIDGDQAVIADVTGLGKHAVAVTVKRIGGGFGAKEMRACLISASTSLAAILIRKPVKMHMSLQDNLRALGKRFSYYVQYNVGFGDDGKLDCIILDIYSNAGAVNIFSVFLYSKLKTALNNAYACPNWKVTVHTCKTNLPPNVPCRAPGSTEAVFMIESILEHVAFTLKKPSLDVKIINFLKNGDVLLNGKTILDCTIASITEQLIESASYKERVKDVEKFNRDNRWRKKGIAIVPGRYSVEWARKGYNCFISVFHNDGTIAVSHGGIEMGQGINTKVAQVVAREMGIDMKYIKVQPTTALTNANAFASVNSLTSELVCLAAIDCCDQLKHRMFPNGQRDQTANWKDSVEKCFQGGTDLSVRAWVWTKEALDKPNYSTYGAVATEVELDVLTGQYQINRCDVLYDCGESMSPFIDIGQVEGAMMMGFGYYTSEEVIFDQSTGENLTAGTWKYKVPLAKDIPIDFRISLLKNAPNPSGVLRSKLVGEPPLIMTCSGVFALRNAIQAQLNEIGIGSDWFRFDCPLTPPKVQQLCSINISQFRYAS